MAWHTPRMGGRDQPSPIVVGNYLVVADMGGIRTSTGTEVLYARSHVALVARVHGVRAIDQIVPSKKSAMPEGLLNPLSLEEIAALFAYLSEPPQASVTSRRGDTRARYSASQA